MIREGARLSLARGIGSYEAEPPILSVVVPFYNEADSANELFERLVPVLDSLNIPWEILCVNDGSDDRTLVALLAARAHEKRIAVIDFSRNFGKECAVSAGLRHARGQGVVIIDADLQHPPETIPELIRTWRKGYDLVNAVRESRAGQSWSYRLLARSFYKIMGWLADISVPDNVGDFRLLDRRVVDVVNEMPERRRFMKGILSWVGFRQANVTYRQEPRHNGTSRWRFFRLLRFAFDGVTGFSTLPLSIWGVIGGVLASAAFAYVVVRMIRVAIWGIDVPGFESIVVSVLFFGGVQLLSLGIIGVYVGRVLEEVQRRPLYVIRHVYEGAGDGQVRQAVVGR